MKMCHRKVVHKVPDAAHSRSPKVCAEPPKMGHVFGIPHPPVLRRDRWKTLAAEQTRPGPLGGYSKTPG